MTAYIFIRWIIGIYILVITFVILTCVSELLFGERPLFVRLREVGRRLVLAPIWPLLLFSTGGFRKMFRYADNL
ncbi:MAG: hypothetical protein ACREBU_03510 [Nitrososphaera sp.]